MTMFTGRNNRLKVLVFLLIICSNSISPAKLIKLSENLDENEEGDENIYEEIIPEDKEMTSYNSLFLSISQGRREQLEMYRFLGWELDMEMSRGDKMEKVRIILRTLPVILLLNFSGQLYKTTGYKSRTGKENPSTKHQSRKKENQRK